MALVKREKNHSYYIKALSTRVLCVASVNHQIGDWSAYIDSVVGMNHEEEFELVYQHGDKLPYEIAKYLFGFLDEKFIWRD